MTGGQDKFTLRGFGNRIRAEKGRPAPSRLIAAGLALLIAMSGIIGPTAPAAAATSSFFGSREIRRTDLTPFVKWTDMLKRYAEEDIIVRNCRPSAALGCAYDDWNVMLAKLKGKDIHTQIETIHRFMNEARYIIDPINWGVKDYWATPGQFFFKDGDCEDYAIAKYMSLRRLGFDKEKMRIVVLQDLNLGIAHAVLVIRMDGHDLVLDNQIDQVVDATTIRHYRPYYSINETAWWLHRS